MTSELHYLALSKLAPVQVYTHGHPVTSGIPRDIMDYYLSWNIAELPENPQRFYTETLVRIPANDVPWEFFEPRTENGTSLIAGGSRFDHFDRKSLAENVWSDNEEAMEMFTNPNANIYFCAQAPFKFHFTFDKILREILRQDSNAVIVLIEMRGVLQNLHTRITSRLSSEVDMSRVLFAPRMEHHHLMAMYSLADVVLDSVYFGGDTTSREAFETGAPVITLPYKTIGQRWTQAYYRMMGIEDYIASNPDHYVDLAVNMAKKTSLEKVNIRKRIKRLAHEKLYRIEDGVKYWVQAFLDIATRPRRFHWNSEDVGTGLHGEL